jgi:actin related protein 2/3 complex subunit 5
VQEQNYETVLSVLKAFRTNEIDSAVSELSDTDVDVLMKYLYKGFSNSPDKAAALLLWHEKVRFSFYKDYFPAYFLTFSPLL